MKQVTICDNTFLPYGAKACNLGGANHGKGPRDFEWVPADASTARFVTDGDIKHARGRGQVAWLLEPYSLHPENYEVARERLAEFDALLSHSPQFGKSWTHAEVGVVKWYPYGGSWISPDKWRMWPKTENISMLLSEKNTLPGHKLRHEVEEACFTYMDVFHRVPTDQKESVLAPYRFSVVIENERSAWWFTEHLIDCLCVGTVPIYWGTPDFGHFFNPRGAFLCGDPGEILEVIWHVNEKDYNDRRDAIRENVLRCADWVCAEDYIFNHYPELFQ